MKTLIASGIGIMGGSVGISGNYISVTSGAVVSWPLSSVVVSGFVSVSGFASISMMSGAGVSVSGNVWGPAVSGPISWGSGPDLENQQTVNELKELREKIPKEGGDYMLGNVDYIDNALTLAKRLREQGYWVHLCRVEGKDDMAAVYVSKWRKDEEIEKGVPVFN